MTTSADLVSAIVTVLTEPNATSAGTRVYRPGDWATQGDQYPIIKVRAVREVKQSLGRGGPPEFTVVTTVRITGEVSAPALANDAGAAQAEADLWTLQRQIEVVVINSYPLTEDVQQIVSVDSQLSYNGDAAAHLAGIQIDLALEWYQGPDDFAPLAAEDLTGIDVTLTNQPPLGASFDLPQPEDT